MSEATEKFEGIIEMDGRSHDDVHFDEEDDCFTPPAPPTKTEPQAVGELSVPHRWYTDPASDETCCDKCGQPQNDASEFCSVLGRGGIETPKPVEDRTGETMTIAAYTATKYEGYYPPYLNVTKADGADEVAVTVRGCVNHLGEEGEIVRIHIPLDEWTKIADAPNNTRTAEREALGWWSFVDPFELVDVLLCAREWYAGTVDFPDEAMARITRLLEAMDKGRSAHQEGRENE